MRVEDQPWGGVALLPCEFQASAQGALRSLGLEEDRRRAAHARTHTNTHARRVSPCELESLLFPLQRARAERVTGRARDVLEVQEEEGTRTLSHTHPRQHTQVRCSRSEWI